MDKPLHEFATRQSKLLMKRSPRAMLISWAVTSMIICAGCKTTVRHIPADRALQKIEPGHSYSFTNAGWFVPDALMVDIARELSEKQLAVEKGE